MVIVQFTVKYKNNKLKIVSDILHSESANPEEIAIGHNLEEAQVAMLTYVGKNTDGIQVRTYGKLKSEPTKRTAATNAKH